MQFFRHVPFLLRRYCSHLIERVRIGAALDHLSVESIEVATLPLQCGATLFDPFPQPSCKPSPLGSRFVGAKTLEQATNRVDFRWEIDDVGHS